MRWVWMGAVCLLGPSVAMDAPLRASQQETRTTPAVERTVYDMRKLAMRPALSDAELTGRRLFTQRCAICHDPVGQPLNRTPGPWLDQRTVDAGAEAGARQMIETGSRRMPGFQYALRPSQIDDIVAFLKMVTPDQQRD